MAGAVPGGVGMGGPMSHNLPREIPRTPNHLGLSHFHSSERVVTSAVCGQWSVGAFSVAVSDAIAVLLAIHVSRDYASGHCGALA